MFWNQIFHSIFLFTKHLIFRIYKNNAMFTELNSKFKMTWISRMLT